MSVRTYGTVMLDERTCQTNEARTAKIMGIEDLRATDTASNSADMNLFQRVLIADDYAIVRRGIEQTLCSGFSGLQFSEAGCAQAVLEAVRSQPWDLLILDLSLPDRSGLDIMPELRRLAPNLAVLVLTMHTEEQYALALLRSGVSGYLTKESAPEKLIEAVTKVMAGGKYIGPEMAERLALALSTPNPPAPHASLSPRELQIMRSIAAGMRPAQIAAALSCSPKTVATHRARILRKLNLKSTQQIIYYANRAGLVLWPEPRSPSRAGKIRLI
jgi:two-component system, NarL family, invasion response regulator UvrY